MIEQTKPATDATQVRLTLNVAYLLNGEPLEEMTWHLRRMCELAIGNGLLTGDSAAEVDCYTLDVSALPAPLSENEIADYFRQRIGDGNFDAEGIPTRLAGYGLMPSDEFIAEMRERMGMGEDDGSDDLFGEAP